MHNDDDGGLAVWRRRGGAGRDHAEKMKDADPRKLRNLPYAAHGYPFKDRGLRDYFATLLYPSGNTAFKESDFSKNSRALIAGVKRLEAKDSR